MSLGALHDHLRALPARRGAPALLCITGTSGTGKTSALAHLRDRIDEHVLPLLFFDSLGVPAEAEMELGWDSGRGWQKAMTWHWVRTAISVFRTKPLVILEGQFDPQYALAACSANGLRFKIALLDADADTCTQRIARRDRAQTVDAQWSAYLRECGQQLGCTVVDASRELERVVDDLCRLALELVSH